MVTPELNSVCHYTFINGFSGLDGFYRLLKVTTVDTALAEGQDFVTGVFARVGLDESAYNEAWPTLAGGTCLWLQDVNDATQPTLVVPDGLLDRLPDPMVKRCLQLYVAIDLGLIADPAKISYVVTQLNDHAAAVVGVENLARLMANGEQWVTQTQYEALEAERAQRISQIQPLSVTVVQQQQTIANQAARIAALEAAIIEKATS